MNRPSSAPERILVSMCLAALLLLALAAPAGAAATVHFKTESYTDFQRQLNAGQIHAATFNKKAHSVHVTLDDGRHVKASYPSHDEPQIAAQLHAKGASVKVKKAKKKAKAVKHTLRYIAGGILVIVILVVLVVLLVGRRRTLIEGDERPVQGEETPAPAPPPVTSG